MAKRLRVYGGMVIRPTGQRRAIIAAHNAQEVATALGNASAYYVRDYWSVTGNKNDIDTAMAKPGVLFVEFGLDYSGEFRPEDHECPLKT